MTAQQLTMSSPESAELLNKVTDKLILSTIHYQLKIPGLDFPTSPIAPLVDSHNRSTDTTQNNRKIEGSENPLEKMCGFSIITRLKTLILGGFLF